jgi:hypothetical protein
MPCFGGFYNLRDAADTPEGGIVAGNAVMREKCENRAEGTPPSCFFYGKIRYE